MRRHQVELPLGSGIDRGMTVISYGHWGRPVLVFPSEAGRAWDFENNGMVAAVADLVDAGRIRTTLTRTLTGFTAANHRQAHQLLEAGRMIGKLTIAYA